MQTLKWGEITDRVRTLLNASAGVVGAEGFVDEQMRLCAINIQTRIPAFWPLRVSAFSPDDLIIDGSMSVGRLPANVSPVEYYIVDADDDDLTEEERQHHHERGMLVIWPWSNRFDLQRGEIPYKSNGFISFAPDNCNFVVYPVIDQTDRLVVHYREKQTAFAANDITGFPDDVVDAIYAWTKAALADDIDGDAETALRFRSGRFNAPGRYEQVVKDLFAAYGNGIARERL